MGIENHTHDFEDDEWPFAVPSNHVSFCQQHVKVGEPILTVFHDHEGDWQFFHRDLEPDEEPAILCLGCVFEMDRSIGEIADIPAGHMATRESVGAEWTVEEYEDSDDEEWEDE